MRGELVRDISRSLRFLWFILIEEERIIILAFPGFEPTHPCDPSDQKRLYVEGLADRATATQGSSGHEK